MIRYKLLLKLTPMALWLSVAWALPGLAERMINRDAREIVIFIIGAWWSGALFLAARCE
jgi:hypothetical protein